MARPSRGGQLRRDLVRIIAAAAATTLLACSSAPAPNLAGTWKGERTTLTITQDKNAYRIVAVSPKGILSGNYTSEFRDGRLVLSGTIAPMCGDMKYDQSSGKLQFCGEEFVRQTG